MKMCPAKDSSGWRCILGSGHVNDHWYANTGQHVVRTPTQKASISHRIEVRAWVRAKKVAIHEKYTKAIVELNTAYARPHKTTVKRLEEMSRHW